MKFKQIFRKVVSISNGVGALWTAVLMFIITADVLLRVVFNHTMVGTAEIVANSLVGIAFLHFAYVLQEDRHVRATVIYDRFSERGRAILDLINFTIGFALFTTILIPSWKLLMTAIRVGEFEGEGALRVPTSPVRALVIYGSVLMLIECVVKVVDNIKILAKKTNSDTGSVLDEGETAPEEKGESL